MMKIENSGDKSASNNGEKRKQTTMFSSKAKTGTEYFLNRPVQSNLINIKKSETSDYSLAHPQPPTGSIPIKSQKLGNPKASAAIILDFRIVPDQKCREWTRIVMRGMNHLTRC